MQNYFSDGATPLAQKFTQMLIAHFNAKQLLYNIYPCWNQQSKLFNNSYIYDMSSTKLHFVSVEIILQSPNVNSNANLKTWAMPTGLKNKNQLARKQANSAGSHLLSLSLSLSLLQALSYSKRARAEF